MNGKLNGAADRFDKLARRDGLQKDDDALRVLRKLAPEVARKVEALDETFAVLLAKLDAIEAAHEAQARQPSRIMAPREPNGDEVLREMARMTPEARATLMNKLKQ